MNPTKFEVFVGSVLSDFFECEVHHVGQTGDDGIDLIALVGDAPLMIQVKRRGNPAATEGVDVVKLLFASAFAKGASNGMVVTSAKHFTRPAKTWSESRRIVETGFRLDLIDIHSLMSMIDAVASNDSEPAWQQHRGRTIPDFIGDMGKFAHKVMEFSDFDAVIVNEDDESLIVFEHADLTKVYSIELKAAKSCLCTANLSFAKMKEQCKPASIQVLHGEAAEHLASSVPLGSLNPLENRWERLFPDDIVRFDF